MRKKFSFLSRFAFCAALLAGICPPSLSFAKNSALDGTEWVMRGRRLSFWNQDILKFADGQFATRDGADKGFPTATYRILQDGDRLVWSAVQTGPDGEMLEWMGVRSGEGMQGTLTLTRPGKGADRLDWVAERQL